MGIEIIVGRHTNRLDGVQIASEIRDLIIRRARENFLWWAPTIHRELLKLGPWGIADPSGGQTERWVSVARRSEPFILILTQGPLGPVFR